MILGMIVFKSLPMHAHRHCYTVLFTKHGYAQLSPLPLRARGVVVSHPLSMREALGSIPSVSMHPEAVALSHGWFGDRPADSPWNLELAGEVPGIVGCLAGATSGRQIAGTRDFTLRGQVPGQLTRTNICMAQWVLPARLLRPLRSAAGCA